MQSLRYFGAMLIVGAAGTALGLLLAPESGEKARRRIVRSMDGQKRRLLKKLDRQKTDLLKRGRATLEDVGDYLVDELEHAQKKLAKVVPF